MFDGQFLLFLLFIHYVFDFCLQTDFMAKYKQELPFVMFVHVFVWTVALIFGAKWYGIPLPSWAPVFLYAGHYFSDGYKCYLIKKETRKNEDHERDRVIRLFHYDQIWHIVQILVVYIFAIKVV